MLQTQTRRTPFLARHSCHSRKQLLHETARQNLLTESASNSQIQMSRANSCKLGAFISRRTCRQNEKWKAKHPCGRTEVHRLCTSWQRTCCFTKYITLQLLASRCPTPITKSTSRVLEKPLSWLDCTLRCGCNAVLCLAVTKKLLK